jgi:hypothetical protein
MLQVTGPAATNLLLTFQHTTSFAWQGWRRFRSREWTLLATTRGALTSTLVHSLMEHTSLVGHMLTPPGTQVLQPRALSLSPPFTARAAHDNSCSTHRLPPPFSHCTGNTCTSLLQTTLARISCEHGSFHFTISNLPYYLTRARQC